MYPENLNQLRLWSDDYHNTLKAAQDNRITAAQDYHIALILKAAQEATKGARHAT
jgi:hypothetical protein